MILIGLLLILLALGATVIALSAPTATAQVFELAALGEVSASPLAIFLAGAASVVLLGLGVALVAQGTRRKAGRRKELRGLRKDQAAAATSARSTETVDGDRGRQGLHEPSTAGTTGSDTPRSRSDGSGATGGPNG